MKKYQDVILDTETLSKRPFAALIQIAAKPFNLDGSEVTQADGTPLTHPSFSVDIDATSCAMYGMDFEQDTVEWWSKNKPANDYFKDVHYVQQIRYALSDFVGQMEEWCRATGADELIVWCQGTDFDIAIMREAFRRVFGSEDKLPWKFKNVRDARTYFLEAARIFAPKVENPYDLIKTDGTQHHALADCDWSIAAVQWAYNNYCGDTFSKSDEDYGKEK